MSRKAAAAAALLALALFGASFVASAAFFAHLVHPTP